MKTQRGIKKEFNRLYGNLSELCRRIFSEEVYPRTACGIMFVEELKNITRDENLSALLTEEIIVHILEMCRNILRTDYIDTANKSQLRVCAQKLKTIRADLLDVATESV